MDAGPKQDLWNILPVIIVLLLGAAYFAVMETAFASASRIRLKAAADHGNRRAEQALYVLDHFDQAITTLLIGTNILHLTIATLVTVAVQRQWGMWAVTAGTLVTTVVVFFAGEMLPKSIAKKYAGKPDGEAKILAQVTTAVKVKMEDGTEEEHKTMKTKDQAAISNMIKWILSLK